MEQLAAFRFLFVGDFAVFCQQVHHVPEAIGRGAPGCVAGLVVLVDPGKAGFIVHYHDPSQVDGLPNFFQRLHPRRLMGHQRVAVLKQQREVADREEHLAKIIRAPVEQPAGAG